MHPQSTSFEWAIFMSDSTTDGSPEDFFEEDDAPRSKKQRSPVERVIVWTVIVTMLVVLGIEARAKLGYDRSIAHIEKRVDEAKGGVLLAELKTELSGGPSFSPLLRPKRSRNQYCVVEWYSVFKEYRLMLSCTVGNAPFVSLHVTEIPPNIDELLAIVDRGEPLPEYKDEPPPPQDMPFDPTIPPRPGVPSNPGGNSNPNPNAGQQRPTNPGVGGAGGNPLTNFLHKGSESPRPTFTGRTMPATSLAAVLDREETVAALNLTAEQKTSFDELNARLGDKLVAAPSDREGFLKAQAEIHTEKTDALKASLTPEQFETLIQQYASWKGAFGMREPNIAAKLKLSDDQLAQLNAVFSEWLDTPALARNAAEKPAIEKSLSILTPEQLAAWNALVAR